MFRGGSVRQEVHVWDQTLIYGASVRYTREEAERGNKRQGVGLAVETTKKNSQGSGKGKRGAWAVSLTSVEQVLLA